MRGAGVVVGFVAFVVVDAVAVACVAGTGMPEQSVAAKAINKKKKKSNARFIVIG